MSRFVIIAAGLTLLSALPVEAAPKSAFPVAKDGTTNIADCAKADVSVRNECISRSRPVSGKELYAQAAAARTAMAKNAALETAKSAKAKLAAEKVMKVKAPVPAKVVGAPKGFKIDKDGTTNIADCAKAAPAVRDECISRARPLTGKQLAKYIKSRAISIPAVAPKAAPKPAVKAPVAKPAAVAPVPGKGFTIAKDGTTNIADCAKANPAFRNECISRARPVPGSAIYASAKSKS